SSGEDYFSLLGYSREEATTDKDSWLALIHPEDRRPITEEHLLAPNDRSNHVIEYRIKSKDGSWRWLQSNFRASAFDNFGHPAHLLGIDIDVTEQKSRQAELMATRAMVADAARRARIAFWRQEFGFGSMVWSGAAAELLGQPGNGLPTTTDQYL